MASITPRYTAALEYAREAHATQVRKGTQVPYVAHLLGVSSLVLDYGGDEDQAIAALLHDVVEDQGEHHLAIVREKFGERVARIVAACTDGSQAEKAVAQTPEEKRANWELRKRRYLEHLKDESDDVLLVSGCDKLHNARAVLSDLHDPKVGRSVFERFTGRQEGTLWYYRSLADLFAQRGAPMARELADVVTALEAESVVAEPTQHGYAASPAEFGTASKPNLRKAVLGHNAMVPRDKSRGKKVQDELVQNLQSSQSPEELEEAKGFHASRQGGISGLRALSNKHASQMAASAASPETSAADSSHGQGQDYVIERLGLTIPADDPMLPGIKQLEADLAKRFASNQQESQDALVSIMEVADKKSPELEAKQARLLRALLIFRKDQNPAS